MGYDVKAQLLFTRNHKEFGTHCLRKNDSVTRDHFCSAFGTGSFIEVAFSLFHQCFHSYIHTYISHPFRGPLWANEVPISGEHMLCTDTDRRTLKTKLRCKAASYECNRHIQNQTHAIHLDCIVALLCTQGITGFVMNNLISTWKVTSGFFQKKKKDSGFHKRAVSFLDECFFLPGCRATGGKWPLHHSFGTPALSLTPSFMLLFDQAEKHECKKERKKDGADILGFTAAFVSPPFVTACVCI